MSNLCAEINIIFIFILIYFVLLTPLLWLVLIFADFIAAAKFNIVLLPLYYISVVYILLEVPVWYIVVDDKCSMVMRNAK